MSRYLGPRLRIIRRLGKLRGLSRKKPYRRVPSSWSPLRLRGRVLAPGQHGLAKLLKTKQYNSTEYLIRLKVKQRLRFNYGITERQLVNYVRKAKKISKAAIAENITTGQILIQLLEMRLDNIVFRLNMAPTIPAARQLINHGHIRVNAKKVDIASYSCKPRDVISVAMKASSLKLIHRNLTDYHKRLRFYKKRKEKVLAYVLYNMKIVPDVKAAARLVNEGHVLINSRKVRTPNHICRLKDVLAVRKAQGQDFDEIPLRNYLKSLKKDKK